MAKTKTHFLCRSCGGVQSRWMGKCPDCGTWDALERYAEPKLAAGGGPGAGLAAGLGPAGLAAAWVAGGDADGEPAAGAGAGRAVPLTEIDTADVPRLPTGIGELDRVLGGGFVPGSVVLLGGDPGIGKSTLLLQAAARLSQVGQRILYVSSEESAHQSRLRAERLFADTLADGPPTPADLDHLYVLAETNLDRIVTEASRVRPVVLLLDSIQMVFKPDLEAAPGSVTQLRRCCTELVYLAKLSGLAIVLVGHVTKDGNLAGPKLLEHLVDAVLSFEGDQEHGRRVVRGLKNRYGTTLEVGLFEMTGAGLAEVTEECLLLAPGEAAPPGSVLCPVQQGTRCLMVEVQALTAAGFPGTAKRRTTGLDAGRLTMLIAVLEQHGGLRLADRDVFASAVGGLRVVEPAVDLAVCLAVAGALRRRGLAAGTAVAGEVGLGGEVRPVQRVEPRIRAAARLGFRRLITGPLRSTPKIEGCEVVSVRTVQEALTLLDPVVGSPIPAVEDDSVPVLSVTDKKS